MNTPLKALRAGPGAGRLQSHRKWRGTQENGSQRQARSRAFGTAARRAPLQAAGLPADMPAMAIAGATTPRAKHVAAPVSQLHEDLRKLPQDLPCLILVGRCAAAQADPSDLVQRFGAAR